MTESASFRNLPSVSFLLDSTTARALLSRSPRDVVVAAVRVVVDAMRAEVASGIVRDKDGWASLAVSRLAAAVDAGEALSLKAVINATGTVVHTNLGRAPLAEEAVEAVVSAARGYSNLEFDLSTGERGSRLSHVEGRLREVTGAEEVHVVNNNAAAVFLCLAGMARGREVVVSRGELVEIGGSFRVPDVMAQSGATMVEVGTTNRTRAADYERAITDRTALFLKVHRSNFTIEGFTEEATVEELVAIGRSKGIVVMDDQGSGALYDYAAAGIPGAESVRRSLARGADVLTISGDKLLGGPQAGIILGRKDVVGPLRKHPLSRALRLDKLTLAALAATLRLYADPVRAAARIPVVRMMTEPLPKVKARARKIARRIVAANVPGLVVEVVADFSSPGGGAMPGVTIPSVCVAVTSASIEAGELERRLRTGDPAVVARLSKGRLLLDARTVFDREVAVLAFAVVKAAAATS